MSAMTPEHRLPIATARASARHVAGLLRRRRAAVAGVVALYLAASAAGLVAPWMLGRMVDAIIAGEDDLWRSFAILAGAAALGAVLAVVAVDRLARLTEPTLAELREQVVGRALSLEYRRLEASGTGDLLSRVGDDARLVATNTSTIVPEVLTSVTTVLLTLVGLLALDWRLALAGLLAVPSYLLGLRWYLPRSGPIYAAERAAMGNRAQALLGVVQGLPTLRAFRTEAPAVAEVERRSQQTVDLSISVFRLFGRFASRANRSELIGLLALLAVGFWLVDGGAVTVGAVTTAALFFHRLFNPLGALMFLFDELQSTFASLTRMVGVAGMPVAVAGTGRPQGDAVRVRGLRHAYVEGHDAVDGLDLDVHPGHRVALVGASGAGKSTVAAVIAGTLPPSGGDVELGGVALYDVAEEELRRRVCLVSQEVHVFAGTVRENLLLVSESPEHAHPETAVRVDEALTAVGAGWVADLPDGLDTVVGDGALHLTTAQAQHLALARVLLADPALVVLDEATAEAGSAGARDLDRAAAEVVGGRGAVIVAHRLTQARGADEIIVLDQGRAVERGTHDELVAAGGTYATLWRAWSGE
ncbi:ABC transporter ATP-binding protein [Nocardioides sp. R-C-SC26]|uniref:ABC transporter ATP-binding protein n=1 Tax=Nocardioides sp. R-C-SC26 TaxID=2870414 RepID=UPI001E60E930|nr:ABC transporter ATP-binding protein [Nocardioides sp. R-C-SC26]